MKLCHINNERERHKRKEKGNYRGFYTFPIFWRFIYKAAVKKFLVCRHPGHPIRIYLAGR